MGLARPFLGRLGLTPRRSVGLDRRTMSDRPARKTFIPFKAKNVIAICFQDSQSQLSASHRGSFETLSKMLSSIF